MKHQCVNGFRSSFQDFQQLIQDMLTHMNEADQEIINEVNIFLKIKKFASTNHIYC